MPEEVKDIMTDSVVSAKENSTISDVAKAMSDKNVGTVLITNNAGKLSGIVTDRKITTDVIAKGKNPSTTPVREVMTQSPETAKANNPICAEVEHMKDESIRRIPVVDDNQSILGVLSLADVARDHAKECDTCADNILQIESRYV